MKFIISLLCLAAVASAFPQFNSVGVSAPRAPAPAPAAGGAAQPYVNPYGPKVWGYGLRNPWAQPHDRFEVMRYKAIADQNPGILVRVDADGDVSLTNEHGMEVEYIPDRFGNNLLDLYDL